VKKYRQLLVIPIKKKAQGKEAYTGIHTCGSVGWSWLALEPSCNCVCERACVKPSPKPHTHTVFVLLFVVCPAVYTRSKGSNQRMRGMKSCEQKKREFFSFFLFLRIFLKREDAGYFHTVVLTPGISTSVIVS
jgi:hypothetical protein